MRTQNVWGVVAVMMALAAPAYAAEAVQDVTTQREFSAKVGVCTQCHGAPNAQPKTPAIPIIWGQDEKYILKQLHDFRSKDRDVEIMKWMAESVTEEELAPVAAYFAKQKWPAKATNAAAATRPAGVAVCQVCHLENLMGGISPAVNQPTPRLAGQSYDYLVELMRRFASDERKNNSDMTTIMKGISAADREAMARYISGL